MKPSKPAKASKSSSKDAQKHATKEQKAEVKLAEVEAQKKRLKNLIVLGKERGYLTYAEINDHLPDEMTDAEQIEGVVTMLADMGIAVYDVAPDAETLLLTEAATNPVAEEDVVEEAEEALSLTLDSEFGRTTDPVRMYMREMGSVELLTREGEIEIAKRIEDGLKHMIQAISSCPTTIEEILRLAELVEKDEMRIDELVDGLVDADGEDIVGEEMSEEEELEEIEEDEGEDDADMASADLEQLKQDSLVHFNKIRRLYKRMRKIALREGLPLARLQGPPGVDLRRAPHDPVHRQAGRAPVRRAAPAGRARPRPRARDHGPVHAQRRHAAAAFHQGLPRQRDQPQVGGRGDRRAARPSPRRSSASSRPSWSSRKPSSACRRKWASRSRT